MAHDLHQSHFDLVEKEWDISNVAWAEHEGNIACPVVFIVETFHFPSIRLKWALSLETNYFKSVLVTCKLADVSGVKNFETTTKIEATLRDEQCFQCSSTHVLRFKTGESGSFPLGSWYGGRSQDRLESNVISTLNIKLTVQRNAAFEYNNYGGCQKLHENFGNLLGMKDSADVKIITRDGVVLWAHKLILKAQNPVFNSMLDSGWCESSSGIVNVSDIGSKTMEIVLRYIYTGQLASEWMDTDTIVEFVYAAEKYQLEGIRSMLDETLGSHGTEENGPTTAARLLVLASHLGLEKAEKALLGKMKGFFIKSSTTKDFLEFVQSTYEALNPQQNSCD